MSRRWLISVSLLAHAGLGVGLFVSGVWRLDRLEAGHRRDIGLGVMLPPGDLGEGGHEGAAKPTPKADEPKPERPIAKKPHQPEPKRMEAVATTATATGSSDGEGTGSGDAPGKGKGDGPVDADPCDPLADDCGGGGTPQAAVCGDGVRASTERCDDGNLTAGDGCSATCTTEARKVTILPPNVFVGMRISGETQIVPSDVVKTSMLRDGKDRTLGVFKLCIDTAGRVASVTTAASTKYPAYDAALTTAVRGWRYRPYTVDGIPAPACSVVTFNYSMR